MKRIHAFFLALCLLPLANAFAGEAEMQRATNAVRVLREVLQAPDKRIPSDMIANAYAVAVIPDVIKAGFVIGGRHGLGLISVKTENGAWSNPSFISMSGGSIGFQA
ncbi:MAG: lipid-binding SYLF domain-containing protein, partial [Rudaea sp.]